MKTPREILFQRHQAAEPKLDAIRESTIAAVCDRRGVNEAHRRRLQNAVTIIWKGFWRELVWPCRRIWAGLAVAWVVILAVNFSIQDKSEMVAGKSLTPETIMAWRQQERLLAELIGPNETRTTKVSKPSTPQPTSERRIENWIT